MLTPNEVTSIRLACHEAILSLGADYKKLSCISWCDPNQPRPYTEEEIAELQAELRDAVEKARTAAKKRGYKRHPKLKDRP